MGEKSIIRKQDLICPVLLMLKISKKIEYALIALICMSDKSEAELTTIREMSNSFNLPVELLGKIMQRLTNSRIINLV
ncbi:MAG TPA: hypothetical protein ENN22_04915 [bacterium]|nr:hypothetical protein [bacterium]